MMSCCCPLCDERDEMRWALDRRVAAADRDREIHRVGSMTDDESLSQSLCTRGDDVRLFLAECHAMNDCADSDCPSVAWTDYWLTDATYHLTWNYSLGIIYRHCVALFCVAVWVLERRVRTNGRESEWDSLFYSILLWFSSVLRWLKCDCRLNGVRNVTCTGRLNEYRDQTDCCGWCKWVIAKC